MLTSTMMSCRLRRALGQHARSRARPPSGRSSPHQVVALGDRAGTRRARSARRPGRACAAAARTGSISPVSRSTIGWACSTKRSSASASRIRSAHEKRGPSGSCCSAPPSVAAPAVAAGLLGVVHREVGGHEHVLARRVVRGVEQRDADARASTRARAAGARRSPPAPRTTASMSRATASAAVAVAVAAAARRTRRRRGGRARRRRAAGSRRARGDAARSARRRRRGRACR